jgi:hypothetical protein
MTDGPDINITTAWEGAPATAAVDGEIAAPTTTARAAGPLAASKRIKLPDTNKRKAASLECDRHPPNEDRKTQRGSIHIFEN